jgi:hypothetical protein
VVERTGLVDTLITSGERRVQAAQQRHVDLATARCEQPNSFVVTAAAHRTRSLQPLPAAARRFG